MKYKLYTRVLDGGQAVARVIIECEKEVNAQSLSNDLFDVVATRRYHGNVIDSNKRYVTSVFTTEKELGSGERPSSRRASSRRV